MACAEPGSAGTLSIAAVLDRARGLFAARTHSSLAKRVAGTAFLIRVASAGLVYLSQILFARWMGAFEFGVYVYVWTWFLLIGALAPLGLAYLAQRFIPEYRTKGQLAELRGFLFTGPWLCFGLGALAGLIGAAVVLVFADKVTPVYVLPFLIAFASLPLLTASSAQEFISNSFNWTTLALAPGYIVRPGLMLLLLGAAHFAGIGVDASMALAALFIGLCVPTVGQIPILRARLRREVPAGQRRNEVPRWLRAAVPVLLADSFVFLLTYIDVVLLKLFVGPEEIALYYAATKTLALVAIVYFAVASACAHRFSEYYASGDPERLAKFAHEATRMAFWPSLALGVLLLICGRWILALFGPHFADAYPLIFILIVGMLARASVGPAERLLTMVGKQKMCIVAYASAVAANIALCFLLIPSFGLTGAALATSVSLVIESVLLFIGVKRALGIHVFIWLPKVSAPPDVAKISPDRAAIARLRDLGT